MEPDLLFSYFAPGKRAAAGAGDVHTARSGQFRQTPWYVGFDASGDTVTTFLSDDGEWYTERYYLPVFEVAAKQTASTWPDANPSEWQRRAANAVIKHAMKELNVSAQPACRWFGDAERQATKGTYADGAPWGQPFGFYRPDTISLWVGLTIDQLVEIAAHEVAHAAIWQGAIGTSLMQERFTEGFATNYGKKVGCKKVRFSSYGDYLY